MRMICGEVSKVRHGDTSPLGVTLSGRWYNFAVAVPGAAEVTLHVYGEDGVTLLYSLAMGEAERVGDIFALQVYATGSEKYYQYEVSGRCFVDPYAKLITGTKNYGQTPVDKDLASQKGQLQLHPFSWRGDILPKLPPNEMVLYEMHVRGFTKGTNAKGAGTFAGVAEKAGYLKELGINAVLLMPCMEFEETERGRCNYWGYAPGYYYFAPKRLYAMDSEHADVEFKNMVRRFHSSRIEVLMEFHVPEYANRAMVLDALRYWASEYHVDGFRIHGGQMDTKLLAEDPYLSDVKLFSENWDTASIYDRERTVEVPRLLEGNDEYAMTVRRFLKGDEGMSGAFASKVLRGERKHAVVNYITEHNGFTLADLYAYDRKHNDENGEGGRDGSNYNGSWNCGEEGLTASRKIRELRLKMRKNAMVTLLLSRATPMLRMGDEFGQTQGGNNNAYCQDNTTGWLDWAGLRREREFYGFVRTLLRLRKEHPVFRSSLPATGQDMRGFGMPDVSVHGVEAWKFENIPENRQVGILLCGGPEVTENEQTEDTFYLMFNMSWEAKEFAIPKSPKGQVWEMMICTEKKQSKEISPELQMKVAPRTVVLLKSVEGKVTDV